MPRSVLGSDAHSETILRNIVHIRCIVNDAHIVISFETIDRTSVHVKSSQLITEVDFSFPALAEESRLSGVVVHVAKIPDLSPPFGANGGQPLNWHTPHNYTLQAQEES